MNVTKVVVNSAIIAGGAALLFTGCSSESGSATDDRGWGDAGIASRDDTKTHIVNQPNGFGNISVKCDGKYGYMTFSVTHKSSDTTPVIVPDPRCPGYRKDLIAPGQPASGSKTPPPDEE